MGVPALFRWLSKKYPKIISPVIEDKPQEFDNGDGTKTSLPVDTRKPNPNNEEFDNLYLDMNGIVHPCSHPEDRPAPANEEEMMIAIFEYTERVVNMVRPRKLLMIAVDGVAPRAKMNQQRSRRFRSAQEAAEKDKQTAEFYAMLRASGQMEESGEGEDGEGPKKTWDSNSITPGTPFMDLLAASLRYWVKYKASTDPAWKTLKVIISDATVPGEGEHKIMNFVRSQRSSGAHDPNTRHVIYGLDADLIMLGIATHEPHFRVLREDVFANDTKPGHCRKCNQPGHRADECRGAAKKKPGEEEIEKPPKPFIWLHVGILREYLAVEMYVQKQGFQFDLERALDDWVFMCFFVGNDFLPHLPSLDIREDGIDTLIAIWRDNIPVMGGYVTKDGRVDLVRAQMILEGLAKQEDAIFKRRREGDLAREAKEKRRAEQDARRQSGGKRMRFNDGAPTGFDETVIRRGARGGIIRGEAAPDINALPTFAPGQAQTGFDPRYNKNGPPGLTHADVVGGRTAAQANVDNRSAAAALKEKLMSSNKPADNQKAELDALFANSNGTNGNGEAAPVLGKRTRDMKDDAANDDDANSGPSTPGRNTPNKEIADPSSAGRSGALGGNSQGEEQMPEDTVRLWEEGYEDRYYEQKFHVGPDDIEFRHKVARSYVEGLAWVLLYYFQGCPSWTWYYPYHYAPFAADFKDIDKMHIEFEKGSPFRPYEQLMGVMPAASNHTIPPVFHPLMTDEDSPIIEFYPVDFDVDLNGKKFAWQGVALLPFIDEKRLLAAMNTKYPQLTDDERRRNEFGDEVLIFSVEHPMYEDVAMSFYGKKAITAKTFKMDASKSEGLSGEIGRDGDSVPGSELVFPLEGGTQDKFTALDEDLSASVTYHMPVIGNDHKSMILPGVRFADPVLDFNDIEKTRSQAERSGRSHGGVRLAQNGGRSDGRQMDFAARNGHMPHPPPGGLPPPPPGVRVMPPMPGPPAGYPPRDQQNGYGSYGSQQNAYHGGGRNGGYNPPPPPPTHQQQRNGYGGQGSYEAHGGYGGQGGRGSHHGQGGGYGNYDNRNGGYDDRNGGGYGRYEGRGRGGRDGGYGRGRY